MHDALEEDVSEDCKRAADWLVFPVSVPLRLFG